MLPYNNTPGKSRRGNGALDLPYMTTEEKIAINFNYRAITRKQTVPLHRHKMTNIDLKD